MDQPIVYIHKCCEASAAEAVKAKHGDKYLVLEEMAFKDRGTRCVLFDEPLQANGYLSNWSGHPVVYHKDDVSLLFPTAEHLFSYLKADFFGDKATAQQVMVADSPEEAKTAGRAAGPYNPEWDVVKFGFMHEVLKLKAEQNPLVLKTLLNTGDAFIAEAYAEDAHWGIGLGMDDPDAKDVAKWKGDNHLGYVWMRVREDLRQARQEQRV